MLQNLIEKCRKFNYKFVYAIIIRLSHSRNCSIVTHKISL